MSETSGRFWLPPDISTHGKDIDVLIEFLHYFMIVLFVVWGLFFVYCMFRFRQKPKHTASREELKGTYSKFGEVVVVVIEAVLLIGFSMPVWARTKDAAQFPSESEALKVRVVAQQFAWNVHYAGEDGVFGPTDSALINEAENPIGIDRSHPAGKDDITTVNIMHMPVNKPVIVYLTSRDVIHSFWIPMLRVKQDAIPGMQIPLWFEATKTSADVREVMTRTISLPREGNERKMEAFLKRVSAWRTMEDYVGNNQTILAKGTTLAEDTIGSALPALRTAGFDELNIAPNEPIEIHCAQLCGLNHYSMRGFVTVESQEAFDAWMEKQKEFLPEDDEWGDDDWGG